MTWWPVTLILLLAPFATWGGFWLDKQHVLARHEQQLTAERKEAEKLRQAAYQLGRRDATAEIRDAERDEVERTRKVMEEELQAALAKAREAPPAPAEVLAACRQSASCRERGELK